MPDLKSLAPSVSALRDTAQLPHTDAVEQIIASLQKWADVQNDDLTVVLCDYVS